MSFIFLLYLWYFYGTRDFQFFCNQIYQFFFCIVSEFWAIFSVVDWGKKIATNSSPVCTLLWSVTLYLFPSRDGDCFSIPLNLGLPLNFGVIRWCGSDFVQVLTLLEPWEHCGKKPGLASMRMRDHMERWAPPTTRTKSRYVSEAVLDQLQPWWQTAAIVWVSPGKIRWEPPSWTQTRLLIHKIVSEWDSSAWSHEDGVV